MCVLILFLSFMDKWQSSLVQLCWVVSTTFLSLLLCWDTHFVESPTCQLGRFTDLQRCCMVLLWPTNLNVPTTNKFKSDSEHDSYYHSFMTKTNWNNQKIRNSNLLVIKHVLQTKLLRGKLCQIDKIVLLIFSVSEKYSAANFDGIGMQSFENTGIFMNFSQTGFSYLFFRNLRIWNDPL